MHPRLIVGSFALGASLVLSTVSVQAAPRLTGETRVAVAEDKTIESQCVQSVQVNNGPIREKACAAGSVIIVRQTTYSEIEKTGTSDYVVLDGDATADRAKEDQLAAKVHKAKAASYRPLACGFGNVTLRGSYFLQNGTRVSYEVNYDKNGCNFINVRDRALTNGGGANWERTCVVDVDVGCNFRGIAVGPAWTGWQGAQPTVNGNKYVHISLATCSLCGRPYGWQFFQ